MLSSFVSVGSLLFLASGAIGTPLAKRSASPTAGSAIVDVFPPPNATVNETLFPPASVVGFPGPTATGAEPFLAATALAFPKKKGTYPLVVAAPFDEQDLTAISGNVTAGFGSPAPVGKVASDFDPSQYWGNLSPQISIDSSVYGLSTGATPRVPEHCEATQVHYLYRHGARYPTTGNTLAVLAAKLNNISQTTGFTATGPLSFLNNWTYKLGAEILTPYGRQQNFNLGVAARLLYGGLLNNQTATGKLPVFRTESQDRMVHTALNFAAGFFGVPEYTTSVDISIAIESQGFNNSGAPVYSCPNAQALVGNPGSVAAAGYQAIAFNSTATRLNNWISGYKFTAGDANTLLQMCAYETDALGYSNFCELFTEEDFKAFGYYWDLVFWGGYGMGGPTAAAQGKGYLEEFIARVTQTPITKWDAATNSTLDGNNATFPLNQAFYADATHDAYVLTALTAFNLTSIQPELLSATSRNDSRVFQSSRVVPFATNLVIQILECQPSVPTKQIRFIVNDAVVPQNYPGCDPAEYNGLCAFDTVVSALQKRINEIDFAHDCYANYTAPFGTTTNGRAPKA